MPVVHRPSEVSELKKFAAVSEDMDVDIESLLPSSFKRKDSSSLANGSTRLSIPSVSKERVEIL